MWDIVFWANKETVDYVPSIWALQGDTSYKWPTGIPEPLKQKLIETCNPLKTVKFRICKGIARKKGIINLSDAKKYCKKAEYTSSLETTDAEETFHLTKNYSSADEDDTSVTEFMSPTRHDKRLNNFSDAIEHPSEKRRMVVTENCSSQNIIYVETATQSSIPRTTVGENDYEGLPHAQVVMTGEGKKGKLSFRKLKCYEAVIRAVRKRFIDVTDNDLQKSISAFLAGANDREGGRKQRQMNSS
ncbi:hypothetical protein RN001_001421 [Aquatica leii]|uniref:Uncharacterized protein n=1 Tax=Aquatica leii TaxID=1421715 RepID=A0AAN7SSM6_9COLE|nr:hypothetical protein RN001_001421 [Aquatica leii]